MKPVVQWTAPLLLAGFMMGCGTAPPAPAAPKASPTPTAEKLPAANHIVLSPDQGPPGTVVTVRGYLPSVAGNPKLQTLTGNIVLGSMSHGFTDQAVPVSWSQAHPGFFTMTSRIPLTAWLTPTGSHPLSTGPVSLGIQCMGQPVQGCALKAPSIHAAFDITGPIAAAPPVPFLHFSPDQAKAGDTVRVTGWAPLTTVIGQPFGYQLEWSQNGLNSSYGQLGGIRQQLNGDLDGTFKVPASMPPWGILAPGQVHIGLSYIFLAPQQSKLAPIHNGKGAGEILLAPTSFHYESSAKWSNFSFAPSEIDSNANALSFGAPTPIAVSGQEILTQSAYQGPLWQSTNGGSTWRALSLHALAPLTSAAGFPSLWSNGQTAPQATSITLDPSYPHSLFVAVSGVLKKYGEAPPIYNLPSYSSNDGATWHVVPAPSGMNLGDFGGFVRNQHGVFAYFAHNGVTTTEQTSDGGQSWKTLPLTQAAPNTSLTWGPVPNQNNGQMGGFVPQPVLYKNAGEKWMSTATVGLLQGPSNIALLSHGQALLISSSSPYPVELSTSGGARWQYVSIPTPPHATTQQSPYQTLQILPNGSLLAMVIQNTGSGWFLLPPKATQWQAVPSSVLPTDVSVTAGHNGLWWNSSNAQDVSEPPKLHHVLDSQL